MNSTLKYFKDNSGDRYLNILGTGVGEIKTKTGAVKVYFPDSSEYIITEDVVQTANKLTCTVIVYASTWGGKTAEAEILAKKLGLKILVFGAFFKMAK